MFKPVLILLTSILLALYIMRPSEPRPLTAGPDEGPKHPFPLKLNGKVIKGFGRGSKEVGGSDLRIQCFRSAHWT